MKKITILLLFFASISLQAQELKTKIVADFRPSKYAKISPDGKYMFAEVTNRLRVYQLKNDEATLLRTFYYSAYDKKFNEDGSVLLVIGTNEGKVSIYHVNDGEITLIRILKDIFERKKTEQYSDMFKLNFLKKHKKFHKEVMYINFFDNGNYLGVCYASFGENTKIYSVDKNNFTLYKSIRAYGRVYLSDDKNYLFSSHEKYIRITSLKADELNSVEFKAYYYSSSDDWEVSWTFSPDGKYFACSRPTTYTQIYSIIDGKFKYVSNLHGETTRLAFTPDGKYFIRCLKNNGLELYSISNNKFNFIKRFDINVYFNSSNKSIYFSDDCKILTIEDWRNTITYSFLNEDFDFLEVVSKNYTYIPRRYILEKTYKTNTETFKTYSNNQYNYIKVEIESKYNDSITSAVFSPDDRYLFANSNNNIEIYSISDGNFKLLRSTTNKDSVLSKYNKYSKYYHEQKQNISNKDETIYSPNGMYKIEIDYEYLRFFKITNKEFKFIQEIEDYYYYYYKMFFSPDSKYLVRVTNLDGIFIYSVNNGGLFLEKRIDDFSREINYLVFSNNGKYLAISSTDGLVVYELEY